MSSFNVYEDQKRAESYAKLEYPGTYYLAFRDIPELLDRHGPGPRAVDFGCGAGRSTRLLRKLGYEATGVDISAEMVRMARSLDPQGDYRVVPDGDLSCLPQGGADVALSAFTFDNIPTRDGKLRSLCAIARALRPGGILVNLVSAPELYRHEWASFSTKDFPENMQARSGDVVRIVMTDVEDRRPVLDVLFSEEEYRSLFHQSGFEVLELRRPLGRADEPQTWVSEMKIAPWAIYVLKKV
jgi:SAM-dependent methyltransferase